MPNALQSLQIEPLIEQIANGAYLRDIATQTGIDKRRLSERLRLHPDYAKAKECAIECQLDAAEELLADDKSDIAHAREQWRAAAWRAEREVPHRWGARTQIDVNVDIGAALQELSERLAVAQSPTATVEGEALRITDVTSSGFDATPRQHGGPEREQQSAGSSSSAADHGRK